MSAERRVELLHTARQAIVEIAQSDGCSVLDVLDDLTQQLGYGVDSSSRDVDIREALAVDYRRAQLDGDPGCFESWVGDPDSVDQGIIFHLSSDDIAAIAFALCRCERHVAERHASTAAADRSEAQP